MKSLKIFKNFNYYFNQPVWKKWSKIHSESFSYSSIDNLRVIIINKWVNLTILKKKGREKLFPSKLISFNENMLSRLYYECDIDWVFMSPPFNLLILHISSVHLSFEVSLYIFFFKLTYSWYKYGRENKERYLIKDIIDLRIV